MKTTFNAFISASPNCKKFDGSKEAHAIFDFLSEDNSIIRMIDASESGTPALAPVAKQVEELLEGFPNPTISFEDKFTKQAVGLMIRSILEPFGYVVKSQKSLPKSSGAKYFTSASCYVFDLAAPRTLKIVRKIETV